MQEKRRHPRIDLSIKVLCFDFIKSEKIKAQSKNISQSGICITTAKLLPKGKHVELSFNLPNMTTIKAISEVRWCSSVSTGAFATGLHLFLNVHVLLILYCNEFPAPFL